MGPLAWKPPSSSPQFTVGADEEKLPVRQARKRLTTFLNLIVQLFNPTNGSIVFISSEAAIRSIGNMVPYSVTKTAILGLGRSLAELTRGTAVRVNSYMPGTTATESVETYFADLARQQGKTVEETLRDFYKDVQPSNLVQKLIDPMLHGRGVIQLATNPAMNGVTHRADGGTIRSIFG